jgi:hypothetical protein
MRKYINLIEAAMTNGGDPSLAWFKSVFAVTKTYAFEKSGALDYMIYAQDRAIDVINKELHGKTPPPAPSHPFMPWEKAKRILGLELDKIHSGQYSAHSEQQTSWETWLNKKKDYGVFLLREEGRVHVPDTWIIGAEDVETVKLIVDHLRDAGILRDPAEAKLGKQAAAASRAKQLAGKTWAVGQLVNLNNRNPEHEFEIVKIMPNGMIRVRSKQDDLNHRYDPETNKVVADRIPAGTTFNVKPVNLILPPTKEQRMDKIRKFSIVPNTMAWIYPGAFNTIRCKVLSIRDDGKVVIDASQIIGHGLPKGVQSRTLHGDDRNGTRLVDPYFTTAKSWTRM